MSKKISIHQSLSNHILNTSRRKVKFQTISEQWLTSKQPQVKESTYVKYTNLLRNHILPELGEMPISLITTDDVEKFLQDQAKSGMKNVRKPMSAKSVRDMYAVIKAILGWAESHDYQAGCSIKKIQLKSGENNLATFNASQTQKLVDFLVDANNEKCNEILISLYTGIRIGELCALRWEDVLLDEGILQIRHTMQRIQNLSPTEELPHKTKVIITEPKSSSGCRDIPLPEFLLHRLKNMKQTQGEAFLLTGTGDYFVEPRSMSNCYKRVLSECQLPLLNYHALRHTFATRCIEKNFELKALSEILGHSSVNITLNRYVHISMEQKRKNMNMICP